MVSFAGTTWLVPLIAIPIKAKGFGGPDINKRGTPAGKKKVCVFKVSCCLRNLEKLELFPGKAVFESVAIIRGNFAINMERRKRGHFD